MLTIVGYSINDTIVVFDRIRENMHGLREQPPESLAEVANRSLTQTLSRTINTSVTTIVMVLLLFILGVSSIREFALPLMVGLVSGTYSSIFIATSLWYVMKLHFGKNKLAKKNAKKNKQKIKDRGCEKESQPLICCGSAHFIFRRKERYELII